MLQSSVVCSLVKRVHFAKVIRWNEVPCGRHSHASTNHGHFKNLGVYVIVCHH